MVYTRHDVGGDGADYAIYSTSNDIFSESDAHQLTYGLGTDINPSYAPSASGVAYESNQGGTYDSTSDYEIYTSDVNGTGPINQVTDNTVDDRDPSYSPDGDHIAYEGYDGNDYEIYTISVSGGRPTGERPFQVTDNTVDDRDPSYSPDGTQIAYTAGCIDTDLPAG
jgi:Tol biopolymer transport system component